MIFAHSLPGHPESQWETLADHLAGVGDQAADFAKVFAWAEAGGILGRLHDVGKVSAAFQRYIGAGGEAGDGGPGRVDHSTAGAREAERLYGKIIGRLLAFGIAGHHAGLADAADLDRRLDPSKTRIEPYAGWEAHAGVLPERLAPPPKGFKLGPHKGFSQAFLARILFSCLVDADFLETERFYARAEGQRAAAHSPLTELLAHLRAHLESLSAAASDTPVNRLRAEALAHATAKAALDPGLFTLTVPTGGGKTLTSLSFSLEHAVRHGLQRVIYVIPFTSIIEQTAKVFREALKTENDVLEHHASFDWEAVLKRRGDPVEADAGEGRDGLAKLRRAAENWDAPIVVTTAVQFFESLYANRASRCRKLHNLAHSVIVLDEAQTLPVPLLRPCMAALEELSLNYGASIVLCTATQPALRRQDGFKLGFDISGARELAPDPPGLYARLKRAAVERLNGPIEDEAIGARFAERPQMLCIVNSRQHAHDLYQRIRDMEGATHLTTLMCPRHRREVLEGVRDRLAAGEPVRLVSTSLIEAGVDVDFPEVWRAVAGLDQIAQSAGRCNREGNMEGLGRTVVFTPAKHQPPHVLKAFQQAAEGVLRLHADPLTLEAVRDYFRTLYWTKGEEALDAAKLDGAPFPILRAIAERAGRLDFPFASIARAFRMIDETMEPVIVPWDERAEEALRRIAVMDRPRAVDLRVLQQYVVNVPSKARAGWLALSVLKPVHPMLKEGLLAFPDKALYDPETGLRLFDPAHRSEEANLF